MMRLARQAMTYRALSLVLLALSIGGALTVEEAPARSTMHTSAAVHASPAVSQSATCLIHSLPSFVAQGEFANSATVADVIEVECNPFLYGTGAEVTVTAAQLYSRCHEVSWYIPNEYGAFREARGSSVHLHLDVNGNANVGLIAGPHCMVGESLITLDENESPYETFTTSFQVLPAVNTPQGVYATPAAQVEDAESSGVVTIVQAEFNGASEAKVRLGSGQLYHRCQKGEKLIWVRENRELIAGPELVGEHAVELDNNGNGFALAIGSDSCAQGTSLIEGDLEESPFTTTTTEFTVLPPQPTAEPAFAIEKSQKIMGSGSGFTTAPLTASIGETVSYQIVVTNTANVAETFSAFTDAHCDAGTIAGGPGSSSVAPGQSTTYTCEHHLIAGGSYVNEATVTGTTVGGRPLEKTSNQVEVTAPEVTAFIPKPAFTIEKLQEIMGSGLTTMPLAGVVGLTVDYEIVVKNTGNVPLTFSGFSDPKCDAGTIAGGPGAAPVAPGTSTIFTCDHVLANAGSYVNEATVTGTPEGGAPITLTSNTVKVSVPTEPVVEPKPKVPPVESPKVSPGEPGATPSSGVGSTTTSTPTGQGGVLARCEVSESSLHGASGPKRRPFSVQTSSIGIEQVTFYLDGRRLETLKQAQAKHGKFSIKINPAKLAYGAHKLSIKTLISNPNCKAPARSSIFVRPLSQRIAPKFTG